MLKTLRALSAPAFHCFMYPSIVGFIESANLPMMGMVQLSPGRCFFLYRYTYCSRIRRVRRMARVVLVHVATCEADDRISGNWTLENRTKDVVEGIEMDAVRSLNTLDMMVVRVRERALSHECDCDQGLAANTQNRVCHSCVPRVSRVPIGPP